MSESQGPSVSPSGPIDNASADPLHGCYCEVHDGLGLLDRGLLLFTAAMALLVRPDEVQHLLEGTQGVDTVLRLLRVVLEPKAQGSAPSTALGKESAERAAAVEVSDGVLDRQNR